MTSVPPTTYVIGSDGFIREFFVGARGYQVFESAVQPYLGGA